MKLAGSMLDFVLFQLAWLACVTQAARGEPMAGVLAVAAFVALRLAHSDRPGGEALLVGLAMVLGFAWDSALAATGLVRYAPAGSSPSLAPGWIVAMWALLAAVLRSSLAWLQGRPLLAAALGIVGGPMSYLAAARLGACVMPSRVLATGVLAAGWALFMPLLAEAARRIGSRPPALATPRP